MELCFSGKYAKDQMLRMVRGEGGMVGYLGTDSISEVENRINNLDEKAKFYLQAMWCQIARDIGTMATVLKGNVDALILTGNILESRKAVEWIKERVRFVAPDLQSYWLTARGPIPSAPGSGVIPIICSFSSSSISFLDIPRITP